MVPVSKFNRMINSTVISRCKSCQKYVAIKFRICKNVLHIRSTGHIQNGMEESLSLNPLGGRRKR